MGGDAQVGHGYGTMKTRMHPHKSPNGFPYDPEQEIEEPGDWEIELGDDEIDAFSSKLGLSNQTMDPHARYDQRAMFDDQAWGLAAGHKRKGDNLRECIQLMIEDVFRMRPGHSGPSSIRNQFGQVVGTGTHKGWSSAFPFETDESNEPAYSLKDIMMKHEDEWDRTDVDEEE